MIVHAERLSGKREHPRTDKGGPLLSLGNLRGIRVLAIDDDADALGLLRIVLETAGADVITLSSGAAALAHLETARPHVHSWSIWACRRWTGSNLSRVSGPHRTRTSGTFPRQR